MKIIIMDDIYECPIHMYVFPEDVMFKGIRNIYFTDVHARALCGIEIFGPEFSHFENLVFTNCSFTKVPPESFKMNDDTLLRRSKMGEGDTRGSRIVNVNGLVLTNTVFDE